MDNLSSLDSLGIEESFASQTAASSLNRKELQSPKDLSFKETLKSFFDSVNDLQAAADEKMRAMASGDVKNPHDAYMAMEKASLGLQMAIAVRDRVVSAYTELLRTTF